MADIYFRYFKVTSGPLIDRLVEIKKDRSEADQKLRDFCSEVGAENAHMWLKGGLAAFTFNNPPNLDVWKKVPRVGGFFPKKTSREGKKLLSKLESVGKLHSFESALNSIGLNHDFPLLINFRDGRGYCATLCGRWEPLTFFVKIPWKDIDPQELKIYQEDREAGRSYDQELDYLSTPLHESLTCEVKRWEMERFMDDEEGL